MKFSIGGVVRKHAPYAYGKYVEREITRQRTRIDKLLAMSSKPIPLSEAQFDRLMALDFPRAAPYNYDAFSSTARAAARLHRLAALFPMLKARRRILEVSCGDGLVGSLLSYANHHVTLTDLRDWRSKPAQSLEFLAWDVCREPILKSQQFDLVLAYNATEHWHDPRWALKNLLALCRPGGFLMLDFGPLYNSPWGLHAWSIGIPYPQFLFPEQLIDRKIREGGVEDLGNSSGALQPTNGWSRESFRKIWAESGAKIISNSEDRDYRYLNFIEEFSGCFRGRGLNLDELTINSIEIVLQRQD